MNIEIMNSVLDEIKSADRIIIFRHKRPDGDAVGSTMGFRDMLRLSFPEKDIRLINPDRSDYLSFLGDEDEDVDDDFYRTALGIVIDTATAERIANRKYSLCKKVIKIDHHIPIENYGDINLVDEEKSSACELVAEFYYTFRDRLKLNTAAATYIYLGMVTDSGRFRFNSVCGDTMRYAGMLLDFGIDIERLYANLYMRDFESYKFESYVYENMKITDNGVAYLYIDEALQKDFDLTSEGAGVAVDYMDRIKGSLIWIVFIENGDGSTRVRLRSRFVTINELAEKYRGGGHACAAGSTVYSRDEAMALVGEADSILSEYKATHEGWL